MVTSIGSFGPAMNMRALARSSSTSETDTTGETKKSPAEDLFSKLDADASGGLSTSELQSFVDKMSSDTRSALLSTQEASTSSTSTSATSSTTADDLLTAMDEDADGSVSESELDTWMQANRPAGPPPPPPPSEEASATDGTDPASALFGAIDGDGDGSVSETELSDFLSSLATDETTSTDGSSTASTSETDEASTTFDAIDTDGDGAITQAELDAYMKAQMASAPPPPPPPGGFGEESGSDAVSEVASTSSTTSTSSTSTTEDLAARLSAAMARFATEAYGRVDTSSTVSTLLTSVA